MDDWPTLSFIGSIFFATGIVSLTADFLFSTDEPNDERIQAIKVKSGHLSYVISISYTFIIILLFQYKLIDEPMDGFILLLIGNVLFFPISMIYYHKKM